MDQATPASYATRPWLAHYPDGVPHDIDPSQYRSLAAPLEESMKKNRFTEAAHRGAHLSLAIESANALMNIDIASVSRSRSSRVTGARVLPGTVGIGPNSFM